MGTHFRIDVARGEMLSARSSGVAAAGRHPTPTATGIGVARTTVGMALLALERSRARWVLLRGESELGSPEGDVDILLAPADLRRVGEELARLGFARLRRYGRSPHTFFLAYDAAEDCWVKLDLVTELAYGRFHELRLGGGAGCLDRRRSTGGLVVLAPDDGFWTLLLHCLLDKGYFQDAHRNALRSLVDRASATGPMARVIGGVLPDAWGAEECLAAIRADDWVALERAAPFIRARSLSRCGLTGRSRALRNRMMRRLGRIPPFCAAGLAVYARPEEARLAAAVSGRWALPQRRLRLEGSLADRLRSLLLAGWHVVWGRLVILQLSQDAPWPRLFERALRAADLGAPFSPGEESAQEATARVWRRYVEGPRR
jgi:hypothetical protein